MERVPEEKKTGVDRRVEEVAHEHRELEKKLRTKEEVRLWPFIHQGRTKKRTVRYKSTAYKCLVCVAGA